MNVFRKIALATMMLVAAYGSALAQGTPMTRSGLQLEIGTQLPSCGTNCITAQTLRGVLLDIVASVSAIYYDAVVTLQGALVVGTPTGGGEGNGSVNAQSYWLNGVKIPPSTVNFLSYGGVSDGTTDNTAAFNTFIAACEASTTKQCYMPSGVYAFLSQPACITSPIRLFGDGPENTELLRKYNGSGTTGLICITGNSASGTWIDNMIILAHAGTGGGSLVSVISGATAMELIHLSNMWLSLDGGNCTHDYGLYIDGTAASGGVIGVRETHLENLAIFGANVNAFAFRGVEGLTWNGGATYPAGCTTSGPGLISGTAGVPSNNVNIGVSSMQAGLSFDRVTTAHVNTADLSNVNPGAGAAIANTANTASVSVFYNFIQGSVQSNWDASSAAVKTGQIASGIVTPALGGTGINNGAHTITLTGSSLAVTPAATGSAFWVGGALLGDTTNYVWDNTNKRLGIGTAVPLTPLEINGNSSEPASLTTGTLLNLIGANTANARANIDTFGTGITGVYQTRAARGTGSVPTALQSGDTLLQLGAFGYGATGFGASSTAVVQFAATENYTDSAQGSAINFATTKNTSVTRSQIASLDGNGHLGFTNPSATVPTVQAASCGTTPGAVVGSDMAFRVTEGTSATGCQINFASSFTAAPFCVANLSTAAAVGITTAVGSVTVVHSSLSSNVLTVQCSGN